MTGQVAGKVALVTGGASGIGAAVAELLAREGASVAVTDVDELKGPEVVAGIKKAGGEAIFLHQDVTSEPRWIEIVAEVEKRYGRLDILVSNAGIGISVPSITEMTLDGLAAAKRDQSRRRISLGQTLPAGDAQDQHAKERRFDHPDVVAGGPARRGRSVGLLRDQGRRAAVRQVDRDGMRCVPATASASTRCIPASSTRRSGARFRPKPPGADRTRRSIPKSAPNSQPRWRAPVTLPRSPAACCIWPPTCRAT